MPIPAFLLLIAGYGVAQACSCLGYPTICGAYAGADAVFIGSVNRIEKPRPVKQGDGQEYEGGQIAYIQAEKVFKGVKETELIFRTLGTSCDAVYKEGQRWLFYAHYDREKRSWSSGYCGRSRLIESAADDLLYLEGLPASAQKTRISGTLKHFEDDPVKDFSLVRNLAGTRVRLIGEGQTYEIYTNQEGVFEAYGLPPGKYSVEPDIPVGLKIRFPIYFGQVEYTNRQAPKLILKKNGCAVADFVYSADTGIQGKVFGADGRPLKNVCLNLSPKDKSAADNWIFNCTDENGFYQLKEIPPGEYIIVVNYHGKISSNEPFPMAYYPGVFEKEKAATVTISAGVKLDNYDIRIPSQHPTRVIQGVLLYSDGQPAVDEFVEFNAEEFKEGYESDNITRTDAQGRFSLTVLEGFKGKLRGFMHILDGDYASCPQLNKLIKAKADRVTDVATPPVVLEVNRDIQDLKLVFPFPECAKARRD